MSIRSRSVLWCRSFSAFVLLAGICGLTHPVTLAAATVYQCVDVDGDLVFSDRPCDASSEQSVVKIRSQGSESASAAQELAVMRARFLQDADHRLVTEKVARQDRAAEERAAVAKQCAEDKAVLAKVGTFSCDGAGCGTWILNEDLTARQHDAKIQSLEDKVSQNCA